MPEYADPEHYFAISLSLAAVRHEDYERVSRALERVRDAFSWGGSSISVEGVRPKTVINGVPEPRGAGS